MQEGLFYRARKRGLDSDMLGPKFRLPRHEAREAQINYERLGEERPTGRPHHP